jgi:organic hydroperoxide reductase OsmC/OhrA
MSSHQHTATITWKRRPNDDFLKGKYSREHTWTFDGGLTVPASSSPSVVPTPWSNPSAVDPEEAFVASVSSCHMLTFIYLASRQGFNVEEYVDSAIGTMAKNEHGVSWVNHITLNPRIAYAGEKCPTPAELDHLHHLSHEQCFIANSIRTEVSVAG